MSVRGYKGVNGVIVCGEVMSMPEKLQREFFDVSPDDILVYSDPLIGPLHNPQHHLSVKMNGKKSRLELVFNGNIEQVFELGEGIARACQDAFAAYFQTLQDLFRNGDQEIAAA